MLVFRGKTNEMTGQSQKSEKVSSSFSSASQGCIEELELLQDKFSRQRYDLLRLAERDLVDNDELDALSGEVSTKLAEVALLINNLRSHSRRLISLRSELLDAKKGGQQSGGSPRLPIASGYADSGTQLDLSESVSGRSVAGDHGLFLQLQAAQQLLEDYFSVICRQGQMLEDAARLHRKVTGLVSQGDLQ